MSEQVVTSLLSFVQDYPVVDFQPKDFLLRSGEVPHSFFFLKEGCVKMFTTSQAGTNLTLHIFYPGTCFSLLSLVGTAENSFDFQALTVGTAYKIPFEEWKHFIQSHADVSYFLLEKLLLGTHGLLLRLQQSSFVAAYYQVAGMLLYFAKHSEFSESKATTLSLRVTHQDIAEWLGLSRENVSVQMKKLEHDGYLERNGKKLVIPSISKLNLLVKKQSASII